ncbi:hypothetical protein RVR34_14665 [Microcystis aeruginosa FBCC-A68]|uniref:hypothetical protein n=1 Tax=Microcystis aeruginosa TaxID=1126 RepID=UPI002016422B|nr:hypothetical protein [Microcystis aeruginosa]
MNNHRLGALHFVNAPYKSRDRTIQTKEYKAIFVLWLGYPRKQGDKNATSQKPLRGKMKATTASLASQPIACGC